MEKNFSIFFRLTILSAFISIITTFALLFEYTIEYKAPADLNTEIIIMPAYFIFSCLMPLILFSLFGNTKIFKIVLRTTAIIIIFLVFAGMFATYKYSPQRMFLREFNLGGRTEKIIFKNKQCKISGMPKKAFLIYKSIHFFYYKTKNSIIGINKKCLYDPIY